MDFVTYAHRKCIYNKNKNLKKSRNHSFNNPCIDNFFTAPTCPKEISDLMSTFQSNKATGPNSVPSNLLQLIKDVIASPLSDMVNLSFESGKYPQKMKFS